MKNTYFSIFMYILVASSLAVSCESTSQAGVTRTSADSVTDLSGRWNDTDSRLVSQTMIEDLINHPWLPVFIEEKDRKPVLITGLIKNRSSEHIEVNSFIKDIERAVINTGQVKVVADALQRLSIREERLDQQEEASLETMKRLGEETGADYILTGSIISQTDAAGNTTAVVYQVDLELIQIENNEKVWLGSKKIKKIITQDESTW